MLLWELYCAPHYTQIAYVIAITLLGKFSIPFIYANWLHVIASKLKSFIRCLMCAVRQFRSTQITPNVMRRNDKNFEVTRQNEIRF